MTSPYEAQRLCRLSQERADRKRVRSVHPWPEYGDRIAVLLGSAVAAVVILALVALTWAAV